MRRVAIIGNTGGGKSTVSRVLSQVLGLPLYPIDKLQWKPGWVHVSPQEFRQQHDALLALDRWIIDGWGPEDSLPVRFAAADTIIVVDHPLYIHYWWAFKRQVKCLFRPRPDGPEGCPMLPMTWQLAKMIWHIHQSGRPRLLQLIDTFRDQKQVIHIRSPHELRQFVKAYC